MKNFLKRIFYFTLPILFYFCLCAFINKEIFKRMRPLSDRFNVLIIGDSHMRRAIDPALFKSAINISQQGEPYNLSYWKLKYYLASSTIDTVILGFSHHSISAFNEMKFWNKTWSTEMFKRSYHIHNFFTHQDVKVNYTDFAKVYFHQMCLFPHRDHFHFIGEFENEYRTNLSKVNSAIERHFFYESKELGVSEIAISYLDSIINLCVDNKITPIMVGPTVHKSYYLKIPQLIKDRYSFEKQRYINKNIIVIDKTFDRYDDTLFLNVDHLNMNGTIRFSRELIEAITNHKTKKTID